MLSLVLCGFEILSFALEEHHRLRVPENGMLRNLFGLKMKLVKGCCRRIHNKELRVIHPSPHIFRMIKSRGVRWAGLVARLGDKSIAYTRFDGET
jgi:hypothetical protein